MLLYDGVARLVINDKEEGHPRFDTNKQFVLVELDAGDYKLVVITTRVPETNLELQYNECKVHNTNGLSSELIRKLRSLVQFFTLKTLLA